LNRKLLVRAAPRNLLRNQHIVEVSYVQINDVDHLNACQGEDGWTVLTKNTGK
jgi:hypothetical protein